MRQEDLSGALDFLRAAERLKDTFRSGFTAEGRPESTAAHTWRLALMAIVFEKDLGEIDFSRLLKILIVHDLGEALSGDVPAVAQMPGEEKAAQERADLLQLTAPLDPARRQAILDLWEEYEAGATPEARLAKGLDKLETILQHNQGLNPPDFDYRFNLAYGRRATDAHPLLQEIRAVLDAETEARAENSRVD
ncbi:HD domain-containing protein [Afifella sp. YEN Y35]|uniref:HD domain-containing protein n=1 Tax=Afifella sp. YEN Y35 TaxID=3388337 RepID=UPI0039E05215